MEYFLSGFSSRYVDFNECYTRYLAPKGLAEKARKAFEKIKYFNGSKPTYHEDLDGWVFRQISSGSEGEGSVLRPIFNKYLKKIVKKKKLNISFPKEYLVLKPNVGKKSKYSHENFFVISEKLDLKDYRENIEYINNLSEKRKKKVASDICDFIYYTGFQDAHFGNFLFTKNGKKLMCVDNDPWGFMLLKGINRKGPLAERIVRSFLQAVNIGLEGLKKNRIEDLRIFNEFLVGKKSGLSEREKNGIKNKRKISFETNLDDFLKKPMFFPRRHLGCSISFEKDFLRDFANKDIFVQTINKYLKYARFRSHLQSFTIFLSILCPLILLIVIIFSFAYDAP
jgi:hypothetical protein